MRVTPMKVEHTMNLSVVVSDRLTQGTRNSQRNSPLSTWRPGYTVSGQCWGEGAGAGEGQGLGQGSGSLEDRTHLVPQVSPGPYWSRFPPGASASHERPRHGDAP